MLRRHLVGIFGQILREPSPATGSLLGHRVEWDEAQHSWVVLRQVVDSREGRLGREAERGGGKVDFARLRGRARGCLEFGSSAKASWLRGWRRKSLDGIRCLDEQRSGDV